MGIKGLGLGLKDKTCWFCGDFSALSRGKVAILVGRACLVPVNTALCPVCGFCVPGFWVRGAASCGARRPGRSGQVLWVVAEQCRMQFPYQPFRY